MSVIQQLHNLCLSEYDAKSKILYIVRGHFTKNQVDAAKNASIIVSDVYLLCTFTRDAPIAIFLADSDFQLVGIVTCRYQFLQIPIFFQRTIIDSIYKQKSMQI